jgi:hypothetical protein
MDYSDLNNGETRFCPVKLKFRFNASQRICYGIFFNIFLEKNFNKQKIKVFFPPSVCYERVDFFCSFFEEKKCEKFQENSHR